MLKDRLKPGAVSIASTVIFFHLLLLLPLLFLTPSLPNTPLHTSLSVKTYKLSSPASSQPPKQTITAPTIQQREFLSSPEREPIPSPTPKSLKKSTSPPLSKKRTLQTSSQDLLNQEKLLTLMQQSLDRLNTWETVPLQQTPHPTTRTIGKLSSEGYCFEERYEAEMTHYLQSLLSLPEKGEVKLKLTLTREGGVDKIDILSFTSEENRTYITTTLIGHSFPPFQSHFKGEMRHTFTLIFTSR
jgi:hypothetical protein